MNIQKELAGVTPIIPTPFLPTEEIDETALRRLIAFAVRTGIQVICVPAYASEFYKLTDEEKLLVVRIAIEEATGRLQIIAQSKKEKGN